MSAYKLKAELTGIGAVNNSYLYLEKIPEPGSVNAVPIWLRPKNASRKEWTNANIHIEIIGNLEIRLIVYAYMGTKWTFKLSAKKGTKWESIYETEGTTGSEPEKGINISIVDDSVTMNLPA